MSMDEHDIEWRCGCGHTNPDCETECRGCGDQRYHELCERCHADIEDCRCGDDEDHEAGTVPCPDCGGEGKVVNDRQYEGPIPCKFCDGIGRIVDKADLREPLSYEEYLKAAGICGNCGADPSRGQRCVCAGDDLEELDNEELEAIVRTAKTGGNELAQAEAREAENILNRRKH